jgi:hypothetical protein
MFIYNHFTPSVFGHPQRIAPTKKATTQDCPYSGLRDSIFKKRDGIPPELAYKIFTVRKITYPKCFAAASKWRLFLICNDFK